MGAKRSSPITRGKASKKPRTDDASTSKGQKGKDAGTGGAAVAKEIPKPKASAFKTPSDTLEACKILLEQMRCDIEPKMVKYVTRTRSIYEFISSFNAETDKATMEVVKDYRKTQIESVEAKATEVYEAFNLIFPEDADAWKKPPPGKQDLQTIVRGLATKVDVLTAALQYHHELFCAIHNLNSTANDVLAISHNNYDYEAPFVELEKSD